MSRIGNAIITLPAGVTLVVENRVVIVRGPKGELKQKLHNGIEVAIDGTTVTVSRKAEDKFSKSLHGLTRSLIASMVIGVTDGFEKRLEMVGTGYRAVLQGTKLVLSVGFSHQVNIEQPQGITFAVEGNNKIIVKGTSKHDVGQIAANIRRVRPPEPYKGKGIKYVDEVVRRKAGKAVKAAGAAA
ncbi:MAG TPA: 50S ribosomal protein L6 [Candidatus Saccharimonadia bacterium]|nr:50S ribosomal protein L6 [Candidatus Saccharimonadia bacterium]